jgi:hypothetical protein
MSHHEEQTKGRAAFIESPTLRDHGRHTHSAFCIAVAVFGNGGRTPPTPAYMTNYKNIPG